MGSPVQADPQKMRGAKSWDVLQMDRATSFFFVLSRFFPPFASDLEAEKFF